MPTAALIRIPPEPVGSPAVAELPAAVDVLVIGAGLSGIAVSRELRRRGIDHLLLERGATVGGTWRDNVYPGAACDIPSELYSLSWAPTDDWSTTYAEGPEIQRYLTAVARREGVFDRTMANVRVKGAQWQPGAGQWRVSTDRGEVSARILISCAGALSEPATPAVPGLESFAGQTVHTGAWPRGLDLRGARVAVVGTGASAAQVVPAIVDEVVEIGLFQRTPSWVLPRRVQSRESGAAGGSEARVARRLRTSRSEQFWRHEVATAALARLRPLRLLAQRTARRHLDSSGLPADKRRALTPDYEIGCKRVLLSDDFYPTLARSNVTLHAGLSSVSGHRLSDAQGKSFEADVLVLATGFQVLPPPLALRVQAGQTPVALDWGARGGSYLGLFTAGVPNCAWLTGPNSGLGANSMITVIEAQAELAGRSAAAMLASDVPLAVAAEVQQRFVSDVASRAERGVWTQGGCQSWYLDGQGRLAALWPGLVTSFARQCRRADAAEILRPVAE